MNIEQSESRSITALCSLLGFSRQAYYQHQQQSEKEALEQELLIQVEQFYILLLDRSNQLFAWKQISVGGISATFTDPKLIFQTALLCHSVQIIILHNHPSGNTQPSLADSMMTKKLKEGGELLEIKVLDHVILTKDGFYSFANGRYEMKFFHLISRYRNLTLRQIT